MYLCRNFPSDTNAKDIAGRKKAWSGLEAKICMRSYKMFFVAGSEDSMITTSHKKGSALDGRRKDRFRTWLETRVV